MFVGKGWNKVTQPLFHDANSKRGGVLMHAKVSKHIQLTLASGLKLTGLIIGARGDVRAAREITRFRAESGQGRET
jgi:hypothetical protein